MRYRNLILGAIIGAVIGAIFGAFFGAFNGASIGSISSLTGGFAVAGATLSGLVGTIDDSDLTLVIENLQYKPGDKVHVGVFLRPKRSYYVRSGQIALACVETCSWNDEAGSARRSHQRWCTALPFMHEQQVFSGQTFGETLTFSLPEDSMPSLMDGAAVEVYWKVQASLDIAGAQDIQESHKIYVLPLVAGPSPPAPVSKEQIFDQCVASLSLSSATACAGERIEGTFKVQVRQDLKVRSIRVVLECWEKAGDQEEKTKVTNILLLKNNILGGTLTTNRMLEWPIRLQVPKNILPSAGTSEDNTQVVWRVKGILNRFMLRDLEVQQQIHVYIDPQGS